MLNEVLITINKISVDVNGQKCTLPTGSTLGDALKISRAPYVADTEIVILKETAAKRMEIITEYAINTPKGEFRIELKNLESPSGKLWTEHFKKYEGKSVRWVSTDALAFGPFEADIIPSHEVKSFETFDVLFGAGGFDPSNTHLIFSRKRHTADYGSPKDNVFAEVVTGRQILFKLSRDDSILNIKPIIEWEQLSNKLSTTDLSTTLENGDEIFTYLEAELSRNSPIGAEQFYALTREGTLTIDVFTSSFISDDSLKGEPVPYENFEPRGEGAISIRTVGYGTGRTYISKEELSSSLVHSVIGHVTKGIELIKLAEVGQKISVESIPPQIVLLGHSFEEINPVLSSIGIELIKTGYTGKDAVIVSHAPSTTLEILGEAKVTAYAVPKAKLIEIELYPEEAPKSVDFFRHSLGLKTKTVGNLPVYMIYDNTYLFKTEKETVKYKEILPENTPKTKILAGEIGITNQAAKRMGTIGVKLVDDDLFGPTGEKFSSTNLIGRIIEPLKLKDIKEGDVIYVSELLCK